MSNVKEITQRFMEAYEHLRSADKVSSLSDFADKIGISGSMMTEIKNNRSNVGLKAVQNTVKKFSLINPEWLLTGKGNMGDFRSPVTISTVDPDEEAAIQRYGIPLIPIDAMAGWASGEFQIMDFEADRYVVPEFNELKVDFMIRVKGNSMYPKLSSGNIVACIKLPLDTFFQWNKIYVLDTRQGAMIKRIKKSTFDNHILCFSDNSSYDPFDLDLKEVNSLALVVGIIGVE